LRLIVEVDERLGVSACFYADSDRQGKQCHPSNKDDMILRDNRMLFWAAAGVAVLFARPALADKCEFTSPGKAFSVEGVVLYVDAANELVVEMGYGKVVAIDDRKRGCTAYVQASRVSKCAKGKTAAAKGATFVVPFTPVVLAGADIVKCR
jgi:hypothetical protein